MAEQRSPLKEFRHLDEKLRTVGLSPAEQARYQRLRELVEPEAPPSKPGFDVNAAAEALRASLEPDGQGRAEGTGAQPLAEAEAAQPLPPEPPGTEQSAPQSSDLGVPPAYDPAALGTGPEAFDAGALPPDPGPPGYEDAAWEASPLPGAEAEPLAEPTLEEAEPIEGAQEAAPEAEGGFDPAPVGGPGAYQAAEASSDELPRSQQQEDAAAPPGIPDAPSVPLASAAEFISYAGSGATPGELPLEGELVDISDLELGELPQVDLSEIEEEAPAEAREEIPSKPPAEVSAPTPTPPAAPATPARPRASAVATPAARPAPPPAPARTAPPPAPPRTAPPPRPAPPAPVAPLAPSPGGPAPSYVAGEHRVVVHTVEGQVLRGTVTDVDLDSPSLPLTPQPGAAPQPIPAGRVKAIFFMLLPGGRPPPPEGRKVRVTFRDGRQVAGFSPDYDPGAVGFFMVPADSRTNTGRIWVYREAVRQISVS